jgi:hypothetical protein
MWAWLKCWVKKYDNWCQSLGLTLEHKRSCVPYRKDPVDDTPNDKTE